MARLMQRLELIFPTVYKCAEKFHKKGINIWSPLSLSWGNNQPVFLALSFHSHQFVHGTTHCQSVLTLFILENLRSRADLPKDTLLFCSLMAQGGSVAHNHYWHSC